MDRIKQIAFGGMASTDAPTPPGHEEKDKAKKQKPLSKKLSSNISACSSKMTEILSWQSKLDENKTGLMLVSEDNFLLSKSQP